MDSVIILYTLSIYPKLKLPVLITKFRERFFFCSCWIVINKRLEGFVALVQDY